MNEPLMNAAIDLAERCSTYEDPRPTARRRAMKAARKAARAIAKAHGLTDRETKLLVAAASSFPGLTAEQWLEIAQTWLEPSSPCLSPLTDPVHGINIKAFLERSRMIV